MNRPITATRRACHQRQPIRHSPPCAPRANHRLTAIRDDHQHPSIVRSWRDNWDRISPFFAFPRDIRKAIYTTNAIEALNRQLRKALKPKGHFPSDDAVYKILYLALLQAERKWTRPIKRWDLALQQFSIHFSGRLSL